MSCIYSNHFFSSVIFLLSKCYPNNLFTFLNQYVQTDVYYNFY